MNPTHRPLLPLTIEAEIEELKRQIHNEYWPRLQKMQELTDSARDEMRLISRSKDIPPKPPRAPQALLNLLVQYSLRLFELEAKFFPVASDSRYWLEVLRGQILGEVMERVKAVEDDGRFKYKTIAFHNVPNATMIREMGNAITARLEPLASEFQQRLYNETARHYLAIGQVEELIVAPSPTPKESTEEKRRKVVEPLLQQKGWSPFQWAVEAEVAYNTVADYLAGRTKPQARNRVKLARVLGIEGNQLP